MIDFACKKLDLEDVIRCSLNLTKTEFIIIKYLLKNNYSEFTSIEISKKLKIGLSTVQRAIKKMNEGGILKKGQRNLQKGGYIFIYSSKKKLIIKKKILEIIENWVKKFEAEMKKW